MTTEHATGALQRLPGGHGRHHRAAAEEGGVEGTQVPQSARDQRPREEGAAALPGTFIDHNEDVQLFTSANQLHLPCLH